MLAVKDFQLEWSKITLITRSVGGAWVDPSSWKMDTFFLGSLALSVSIYRNFQSNGANWRSFKLRKKFFYLIGHYINFFVQSLTHYLRAKDPRKNVSIFQEGRSIPAPPTPIVIRVVLLHIVRFVQSFNSSTVVTLRWTKIRVWLFPETVYFYIILHDNNIWILL